MIRFWEPVSLRVGSEALMCDSNAPALPTSDVPETHRSSERHHGKTRNARPDKATQQRFGLKTPSYASKSSTPFSAESTSYPLADTTTRFETLTVTKVRKTNVKGPQFNNDMDICRGTKQAQQAAPTAAVGHVHHEESTRS